MGGGGKRERPDYLHAVSQHKFERKIRSQAGTNPNKNIQNSAKQFPHYGPYSDRRPSQGSGRFRSSPLRFCNSDSLKFCINFFCRSNFCVLQQRRRKFLTWLTLDIHMSASSATKPQNFQLERLLSARQPRACRVRSHNRSSSSYHDHIFDRRSPAHEAHFLPWQCVCTSVAPFSTNRQPYKRLRSPKV